MKQNTLKKLLMTASAFAVITGSASTASAVDLQVRNGNVTITNAANGNPAANLRDNANANDAQFTNDDALILHAVSTITTGGALSVGAITANGAANAIGSKFVANHDTTFRGDVVISVEAGANAALTFDTANAAIAVTAGAGANAGDVGSTGATVAAGSSITNSAANALTITAGAGNGNGNGNGGAGLELTGDATINANAGVINITGGAGNNNGVGVVIGANQATFNTSAAIVITGGNGANGATIAAGGSIIHSGAQDLTIAGNGNGNGLELAGAATVKSTGTGKVVISGANAVNGNHALTLESGNIELDGTAGNAVGGALIASGADITITQGNVAGDVSISNGSIKHTVGNLTQKLTVSGSGSYVGNSNVIGDVLINTSSDTLNKINTNAANVKVKVTEGKLEINTSNDAKYDVSGSASFLSFANGNANSNVNVTNSGTFVLENQAEAKIVDINGGTLKIGTDAHNIHTLKFSGVSNTLHTTSDNLGAVGNISVTNNFDLNKSTQIQVVVNNDAIRGTKIDSTIQHDLLNLSAIANPQIDLNQLSVVAENPFIDASNHYDTNTKIVKISYKRDVAGGVSDVAKKGNISLSKAAHENLVILSEELDKSPNSDISKAQDVVMTNYFDAKGGNDEVKFKKAEKRVVEFYDRISASDQVNSSISSSLSSGISAISNRSISLIPTAANNSNPGVGVSSGSDSTKSGAWFMPFYGSSTQKLRKGIAGYKNTAYGGVVGFDTKITDNTVVGLSLANNNSLLKYKDAKSGDKTKLEGSAVSIYGATNLTSNWFTTGSLTVGTSQVKNSSKRIHGATDEIAKSKNTARSFALDSRFGYNYSVNNCYTVTPLFGMTYQNIKNSAYKETGTTAQNLSVSMSKASDRLDAVLGVKTSYLTKNFNGVLVTPEVHAFVKHDLINKNATQSINLGEIALSSKATKPVATEYNVGLSANVQYGFMEYSASYDADFATKRVGHQGSLKVRVNF